MKQFWNQLPIWGKVILIVIIAIIVYKIYRIISDKITASHYNAAVNQAQSALNQLAAQGVKPSYGQGQYTGYADTLQGAFQGCTGAMSANEFWNIVHPVFDAMKNDADVYALIQAYGTRSIDKCGLFTGNFEGNLPATLAEKFSGTEGFLLRKSISDINDILKSHSIVYTF